MKLRMLKTLIALWVASIMMPVISAEADELVRLNIVAFEKRDPNYEFDSIITGTYAQLFEQVQGKADVIFLNRTPVLKNGDVVNLQLDALRMAQGNLSNGGLNCQFGFTNESDEGSQFYSIAGMCNIMYAEDEGTRKVRLIIKRAMLSDVNYGMNVWMKVYEDKTAGVVIYGDVDPK